MLESDTYTRKRPRLQVWTGLELCYNREPGVPGSVREEGSRAYIPTNLRVNPLTRKNDLSLMAPDFLRHFVFLLICTPHSKKKTPSREREHQLNDTAAKATRVQGREAPDTLSLFSAETKREQNGEERHLPREPRNRRSRARARTVNTRLACGGRVDR